MKVRLPKQAQKPTQWVVLLNNHQYTMDESLLKATLKTAKEKFRKDKQTAIYAVVKGNVVQMLNEPYETAQDLKKAITQYKCKGFYKVHYYLAV